jgi:integrase
LTYEKKEPKKKTITFAEAIDLYIKRLQELKRSLSGDVLKGIDKVKQRFAKINIYEDKNIELQRALTEWRQQLVAEGKKPSTINRYTQIVSTTMNLLKNYEIIKENPITSFRFPPLKHFPRDRILSAEEEIRLLDTVKKYKPYLYPMVHFCLIVPSRWRKELFYATTDQYQKENNLIYIPATDSKGKVPIYKPIPKELQWYFDSLPDTQKYIFFAWEKPFTDRTVEADFRQCCKDAEIVNFCLHDLRHCAVSKLVENGNSSWDICSVTGWTTPTQLTTYYHFDRLKASLRLKF